MSAWPPEDVLAYYGGGVEVERLAAGAGALELERTKELLRRFLPAGSRVADVGGGTGLYAAWLAGQGHGVELVEPVALHVEQARRRAGEPPRFGVHLADARALPFPDESFDAVLLLGPLYHLGERRDRLLAIREAARVCRSGGLVFAAAISRFAPVLDAIGRRRLSEAALFANVLDEVREGRRVASERRTSPFPDAYFHRPDELEQELRAGGVEVRAILGVEGLGGWVGDLEAAWEDAEVRERILRLAGELEADRDVVAVSAHLLALAERP